MTNTSRRESGGTFLDLPLLPLPYSHSVCDDPSYRRLCRELVLEVFRRPLAYIVILALTPSPSPLFKTLFTLTAAVTQTHPLTFTLGLALTLVLPLLFCTADPTRSTSSRYAAGSTPPPMHSAWRRSMQPRRGRE